MKIDSLFKKTGLVVTYGNNGQSLRSFRRQKEKIFSFDKILTNSEKFRFSPNVVRRHLKL